MQRVQLEIVVGAAQANSPNVDVQLKINGILQARSQACLSTSVLAQTASFDLTANPTAAGLLVGQQLLDALLPVPLSAETQKVLNSGPATLLLDFCLAQHLHAYPWELLADPRNPGEFLLLDPGVTMVRMVKETGVKPPRLREPGILYANASPRNLTPLDLSSEVSSVEAFAASNGLEVCILRDATERLVMDRLRAGEVALFYFSGHGRVQPSASGHQDAEIALVKDRKYRLALWSSVREMLRSSGPSVVLLNACNLLGNGSGAAAPSIVSSLCDSGVRSVVGFRNPARADIAHALANELMLGFLASDRIDDLVSNARLYASSLRQSDLHWANIILFSSNTEPMTELRAPPRQEHIFYRGIRDDLSNGKEQANREITIGIYAALIFFILLAVWWAWTCPSCSSKSDLGLWSSFVVAMLGLVAFFTGIVARQNIMAFAKLQVDGLDYAVRGLVSLLNNRARNRAAIVGISHVAWTIANLRFFDAAFGRRARDHLSRLFAILMGHLK